MDTNNHLIDKCLAETYKHIKKVGQFLHLFAIEIIKRSDIHDNSKLEEPELTGFAINTEKLGKVEYGSDEYKQMLLDLKPTIDHHYAKNRHHTEFRNKQIINHTKRLLILKKETKNRLLIENKKMFSRIGKKAKKILLKKMVDEEFYKKQKENLT